MQKKKKGIFRIGSDFPLFITGVLHKLILLETCGRYFHDEVVRR